MDWSNVMFLNLEVEENSISRYIPKEFEIRTYNSKAYITLVFFNLECPGFKSLNVPISFSEFNIRTYVQYKIHKGIYFLTLDVKNKLIPMFVNSIFKLNYSNTFLKYETKNYSKNAVWRNKKYNIDNLHIEFEVGKPMMDSSFSNFITENYLYISKNKNSIYYNKVYHKKWNLNYVNVQSISEFTLFGQNKIHSIFYCDKLKVRTGFPVRLK
tara:strand:+ start:170 stop:805 length:636 start_codon:yes stop_codon:yes gene_type:complete